MKKALILSVLIICCINIYAINITGRIVDKKGRPLNGAMLMIAGNPQSNITINKSGFKFINVNPNDTLVVHPTKSNFGNIILSDATAYDIKYDKRKLFVTTNKGSFEVKCQSSQLSSSNPGFFSAVQIEEIGATTLVDLLMGRVPGLEIMQNDNGYTAKIRGGASSGSTEPIYVVDGTIYNSSLESINNMIDMEQVESVEVLKEGSMYGSRGANGAIVIKYKK